MRKNIWLLVLSMLSAVVFPTVARASESASKAVYTSDAWVLGISGDTGALCASDSIGRLIVNPIKISYTLPAPASQKHFSEVQITEAEAALNSEQAGRKVIDYLLGFDGKGFDESVLMRRAAANHELTGLNDIPAQELKNMFPALLTHNYIYLVNKIPFSHKAANTETAVTGYYTAYMLFKIEVPYNAVVKFVANPTSADYKTLPISVKCLSEGIFGTSTTPYQKLVNHVSDFAPEAVVVSGHPAIISSGTNQGYKTGDLLNIYRSALNGEGILFSKRIGYARILSLDDGSSVLMPLTYGANNAAAGDVTIHKSNRRTGVEANAAWTKGMWGAILGLNFICHQNRFGNSWRVLVNIGYAHAGATKDKTNSTILTSNGINHYYIQGGVGISRTFGGIVEVMPHVMVDYSYLHIPLSKSYSIFYNAHYFRFPVGVNFGFNVLYPLQITLTAGYVGKVGFDFRRADDTEKGYKKANEIMKERGAVIDGLFLKAGLRYNF